MGEIDAGLKKAFALDEQILCERFVELGREIRCGVIEKADGTLELLPILEYFLTKESPTRTPNDKLLSDSRGMPTVPRVTKGDRKCPAEVDDVLLGKLKDLAFRSHKALGCRDYSLYDVRVDPNGEPFFLEACLYCSFAPKSVIIAMSVAKGVQQQAVFEMLVNRAIARKQKSESGQLLGMKAA